MSLSRSYDGGRNLKVVAGVSHSSAAVASSSGAALTGATIDRQSFDRRYYSCLSVGHARFVGSTVQNVSIAMSFQHSSDGTSWDDFSTATNASGAIGSTGATGAQTAEGSVGQPIFLAGARRYVRQILTPTFSGGTSGDNAYFSGRVIFTGADESPNT